MIGRLLDRAARWLFPDDAARADEAQERLRHLERYVDDESDHVDRMAEDVHDVDVRLRKLESAVTQLGGQTSDKRDEIEVVAKAADEVRLQIGDLRADLEKRGATERRYVDDEVAEVRTLIGGARQYAIDLNSATRATLTTDRQNFHDRIDRLTGALDRRVAKIEESTSAPWLDPPEGPAKLIERVRALEIEQEHARDDRDHLRQIVQGREGCIAMAGASLADGLSESDLQAIDRGMHVEQPDANGVCTVCGVPSEARDGAKLRALKAQADASIQRVAALEARLMVVDGRVPSDTEAITLTGSVAQRLHSHQRSIEATEATTERLAKHIAAEVDALNAAIARANERITAGDAKLCGIPGKVDLLLERTVATDRRVAKLEEANPAEIFREVLDKANAELAAELADLGDLVDDEGNARHAAAVVDAFTEEEIAVARQLHAAFDAGGEPEPPHNFDVTLEDDVYAAKWLAMGRAAVEMGARSSDDALTHPTYPPSRSWWECAACNERLSAQHAQAVEVDEDGCCMTCGRAATECHAWAPDVTRDLDEHDDICCPPSTEVGDPDEAAIALDAESDEFLDELEQLASSEERAARRARGDATVARMRAEAGLPPVEPAIEWPCPSHGAMVDEGGICLGCGKPFDDDADDMVVNGVPLKVRGRVWFDEKPESTAPCNACRAYVQTHHALSPTVHPACATALAPPAKDRLGVRVEHDLGSTNPDYICTGKCRACRCLADQDDAFMTLTNAYTAEPGVTYDDALQAARMLPGESIASGLDELEREGELDARLNALEGEAPESVIERLAERVAALVADRRPPAPDFTTRRRRWLRAARRKRVSRGA